MDSVGLARVTGCLALAVALCATGAPGRAADATPLRIVVWADRDDDDADGRPDCEEADLPPPARVDWVPLNGRFAGSALQVVSGGDHARLMLAGSSGVTLPWGRVLPEPVWVQGLTPGRVELVAKVAGGRARVTVDVRGIDMRDGEGEWVDMARSHASLERTPPMRVDGPPDERYDDPDALRVVMSLPDDGPGLDGDREISAESVSALGAHIDSIPRLLLAPCTCPRSYANVHCWASAPLRLVIDEVDRDHPLVADRSIKAEVGGGIVLRSDGRKAQMIRVLGPRKLPRDLFDERASSPPASIGRLRATLRPFVVRVTPGGAPAIGGTDAGAIGALRAELGAASAIWGQCGITFGDSRFLDVRLVDPPPSHLLAIGDDLGIAASGGEIHFRVDGKPLSMAVLSGETPDRVARDLAHLAERVGLSAIVSPNARIGPGLAPSVDVSLRRRDGALAVIDTSPGLPLATDPTLSVRIGSVDLSDGLQHFTDLDAAAGTLEERTLLKALDDGDPTTIEVVVVPLFAGGGRIGESFIGSDLSSVRNVVLLDRAGIRARKSSLTLAHELGHVLMDFPGHPDDYGVDTPTLLMDSDAADASPFGPRRITLQECARVVRHSGPKGRVPLLADWPIGPIPAAGAPRP
jgi:hypothetical protein